MIAASSSSSSSSSSDIRSLRRSYLVSLGSLLLFLFLFLFVNVSEAAAAAAAAASTAEQEGKEDDDDAESGGGGVGTAVVDAEYTNLTLTRLAFGSCHKNKYAPKFPNIWSLIDEQTTGPYQVWLWTGDAIYGGKGVASIDEIENEYQILKRSSSYQKFIQNKLVFGTWDDHDYGGNDMGKYMPNKRERRDAFWNFLGWSPPHSETREGVYSSVLIGQPPRQVQLIMLDTRHERDNHCAIPSFAGYGIPLGAGIACLTRWLTAGLLQDYCKRRDAKYPRKVLGDEQWTWLEEQITSVKTPAIRIVVSSVQLLTTNPAMESWGQFPKEQQKLIGLLGRASGAVVVLSGDVHHGEILQLHPKRSSDNKDNEEKQEHNSPFYEITSSGMTHDCSEGIYGVVCYPLLRLFSQNRFNNQYFIGRNFGSLDIDWDEQTLQVNVHDLSSSDGKVVLSTGHIPLQKPSSSSSQETAAQDFVYWPTMDGHIWFYVVAPIAMLLLVYVRIFKSSPQQTRQRGSSREVSRKKES